MVTCGAVLDHLTAPPGRLSRPISGLPHAIPSSFGIHMHHKIPFIGKKEQSGILVAAGPYRKLMYSILVYTPLRRKETVKLPIADCSKK